MSVTYEVIKDGRHWRAMKDGQPITFDGCQYARSFFTKKAAREYCESDAAYDLRISRETEDDVTGIYNWTPEEDKQIDDYAGQLTGNAERWTFAGKFPLQELARNQHVEDLAVINGSRERWIDPDRYFREKRRVMAARAEAFRRAGLSL